MQQFRLGDKVRVHNGPYTGMVGRIVAVTQYAEPVQVRVEDVKTGCTFGIPIAHMEIVPPKLPKIGGLPVAALEPGDSLHLERRRQLARAAGEVAADICYLQHAQFSSTKASAGRRAPGRRWPGAVLPGDGIPAATGRGGVMKFTVAFDLHGLAGRINGVQNRTNPVEAENIQQVLLGLAENLPQYDGITVVGVYVAVEEE